MKNKKIRLFLGGTLAVMGLTFCSCEESNMVVTESLSSKTEVDMETMEESQEETESPATLEADRSEDASNVSRTEALEISSGENKEMQNHETSDTQSATMTAGINEKSQQDMRARSQALIDLLNTINTEVAPGAEGSSAVADRIIGNLKTWASDTDMSEDAIRETVVSWLSDQGNDAQLWFAGKLKAVYERIEVPNEIIKAIVDAVQLPVEADNESVISENEEYPGENVVKVVNSKGESATLYKLADGRYMDRINRVFIYDGADTWTDTNEIIWSRAAAQ